MLKYILLGILQYRPMSGYELERFISTSTAHFWNAKLSQIYRTLKQLEQEALIHSHLEAQEGRPDRRIYTITATGHEQFQAWLNQLITETDDVKLPFLGRFFFYGRRATGDILTQLKIWRDLYQQKADHFEHRLPAEIEHIKADMPFYEPSDEVVWEATRRLGEMLQKTYVRWLDETIEAVSAVDGTTAKH